MKAKTPLFLLFSLCIFASNISFSQQCDVNQLLNNNGLGWALLHIYPAAGNSFVSTCDGTITGVTYYTRRVNFNGTNEASITVSLYENPLGNRILLGSVTQMVSNSGSEVAHFVPFDISVTAGKTYGYVVSVDNNDNLGVVRLYRTTQSEYSQGKVMIFDDTGSLVNSYNWDLKFQIHFSDDDPLAQCHNLTRGLGPDGTVSIHPNELNNNSSDGGTGGLHIEASKTEFDCNDIGENVVTMTIYTPNGQTDTCESIVTIIDETPPVLTCPDDITVNVDPFVPAIVTYDAPTATDNCAVEVPDDFTLLGVYNDKSYFLSDSTAQPSTAYTIAETLGGHLATIEDQEHNDFLRQAADDLGVTNTLLIGYNDLVSEGNFVWHSGASSSYTNWNTNEPNNAGSGEDYTRIMGNGAWGDTGNATPRYFIIELSEASVTQTTGLASGSVFPVGTTTNTFEATDASGNTGTCTCNVTVEENPFETLVKLENGKLTVTDIENTSDDHVEIGVIDDGTDDLLYVGNLVLPKAEGDVNRLDLHSFTIKLSDITDGIEIDLGDGNNSVTFNDGLTMTGSNNGLTLIGLNNYTQNDHINIEGNFLIAESGSANIKLGELTVGGNLTISGANTIDDTEAKISIAGATDLLADNRILITHGVDNHIFEGLVSLDAGYINFQSGSDTTFGKITARTENAFNGLIVSPGTITFQDNVLTPSPSYLFLTNGASITQTGGSIATDAIILSGPGTGTAVLDGVNIIKTLSVGNLFDPERLSTYKYVSVTSLFRMRLGGIALDDFNFIAPEFEFEPGITEIIKYGDGVSNLNGDIDVTTGTGEEKATLDHHAGTINFNGTTNDFTDRFVYTGTAGTITNINSTTTTFPEDSPYNGFTFGFLQASGSLDIADAEIELLNEANFTGASTTIEGGGVFVGGPVYVQSGAVVQPGTTNEIQTLTTNDLTIDGGAFKPRMESDTSHDGLEVLGTVTLTNATFDPIGDFAVEPEENEIILIDNDNTDAVVGTFLNYPEGSSVQIADYAFSISYMGGDGNDVSLTKLPRISLQPKVYLQGASLNPNTGEESLMRDDLRIAAYIPTVTPYGDGLITNNSVLSVTGTDAIVDWIWIELRDANSNTIVVDSRSALLQRDGDVVDVDGLSPLAFNLSAGNYYVVIKHRNHLGIMSASTILLDNTSVAQIDFTNGSISTFGTNAQTTYGMPTNIRGMWAGDANVDGQVIFLNTGAESINIKQTVLDISLEESPFEASVFYKPQGYYAQDINMDGEVIFLNAGNELLYIKDNILAHPENQVFNSVFFIINDQLPQP